MLDFAAWKVYVGFGQPEFGGGQDGAPGNRRMDGRALIAQLGPSEFLITGTHCRIDFNPTERSKQRQFVRVEEGASTHGGWKMCFLWNDDQNDDLLNFIVFPRCSASRWRRTNVMDRALSRKRVHAHRPFAFSEAAIPNAFDLGVSFAAAFFNCAANYITNEGRLERDKEIAC